VLLLVLGLAVFGAAFGLYARFLGWIDGLPELPAELLARREESEPIEVPSFSPVEAKLQQAFGPGCAEVGAGFDLKLELRAKGMVLATNNWGIDPEGRLKLWPFSLAMFKERPGQYPEIHTVHSDIAYLEFDRPVKSFQEINERRIVGCQIESDPHAMTHDPRRGMIYVTNNRATATPDDDLVLETPGPVFYREAAQPNLPLDKARPQLWTTAAVHMVDRRHRPDSTTITAQGMQVFLAVEPPEQPNAPRKSKPRSSSITGVRRVILPANVDMSLWSDPKEGFLATGNKPQPAAAKPAERSHVLICTPGQFTYDILPDGDKARFDRLPPSATPLPNCVRVVRPIARGPDVVLNDQLECDTLELRFAPKKAPEGPPPTTRFPAVTKPPVATDDDRPTISWAHAWGQYIVLTSDAEKLDAHGNDLVYDAKTKGTTLRGTPRMFAIKDGHEMQAPELVMYGTEGQIGQHAEAHGAGYFRLIDRAGSGRTIDARWRDQMVYRQEEGHSLLTLTGDAVFEDKANQQLLSADRLKLWLVPEPKPAATPVGNSPGPPKTQPHGEEPPPKFHPQRLEASGRVHLQTPDLIDHDTEQLVLLFKEAPSVQGPPPGVAVGTSPWSMPLGQNPAAAAPVAPGAPAGQPVPQPPPKKPIDLTARTVQAFVIRRGDTNELDSVHCEEDVRVHQDPVPPQERPVDMRGTRLQLNHAADGDILTVTGTLERPGEVHLPDLSLIGPNVVIDQRENVAEVQGLGSMRMISTTDFDGKKLAKPTPLTVTWKQGMRFTGKQAVFRGFVQADQENTTLLCQTMQVDLNRPVSLKQRPGEPRPAGGEPANVDKVVCDAGPDRPQGVIVTDTTRENGRVVSVKRIEADEMIIHKEEGWMDAANHGAGRGMVRIVQLGPKDEMAAGPPKAGAKKPPAAKPIEQVYNATLVRYTGTMKANNQTRTARFRENVEVLHLPVESPEEQPPFDATVNKLPPGALYLRSNQMTVYSSKDANGQTRQEMVATGKANVTIADQFYGSADEIKYDEAKQVVTLQGRKGNPAHARRLGPGGADAGEMIADKIVYDRLRDAVNVEGGLSATGR
jgi:lipopolysaccharide export system protein LptA